MAFEAKKHLIQLKGKDYLQVAWRLVWFREDHPDWCLDTSILEADAEHAVFKAVVCDENGVQKSTGHGSESKRDFGDFLEKAETKAVGRALAMLGYGTQFTADELDEGERIVDAPINRRPTDKTGDAAPKTITCERCGKMITGAALPDGKTLNASQVVGQSKIHFNAIYCIDCQTAMRAAKTKTQGEAQDKPGQGEQMATAEQKQYIIDNASDEAYEALMNAYGPELENMTANTAAKAIIKIDKMKEAKAG